MRAYDPFARGPFPVGVRTIHAHDPIRDRLFPCEIWYPAIDGHAVQNLVPGTPNMDQTGNLPRGKLEIREAVPEPGIWPLIVFSHSSGGRRRQSTFLCTHLASHGYVVAAMDHSDAVAPELQRREGETLEQRTARVNGWIANRVPDVRFILDHLLESGAWDSPAKPDPTRVGIVGHSFGGWTALAVPETDKRIRAVVALAPGGSRKPPPNIIPSQLTFEWGHDVPTLYLVAEDDTALPLDGMHELFERTQATKRMVILRRADHEHFTDEFEARDGQCSREKAHAFTRGLTLCHMDATLKSLEAARRFWTGDVGTALALRESGRAIHQAGARDRP